MLHGGIQTFVVENIRHMDHDKIKIDFLLLDDGNKYSLEDTIAEYGKLYKLKDIWLRTPLDYLTYKKALKNFFKTHNDYEIVHLHSSSKNWLVLYYAKKYGINIRIAHSHNIGFQTKSRLQLVLAKLFIPLLNFYATDFFACSKDAGKWLFGNKNVKIIHNAVDIKKLKFDVAKRKKTQKELGIEGKFVVGHLGRFTHQKNHKFLFDIFKSIYDRNENACLLLVGEGELKEDMAEYAKKLNIYDKVIFAGYHRDTENYLSAMDIFVFPSKFEGLGLVLIEAQANGLPCFTSDKVVPEEAKVSNNLCFISLDDPPEVWADKIMNSDLERKDVTEQIISAGYRIDDTAMLLQEYYINRLRS